MTHAGIFPQWDLNTAKNYSNIVSTILSSKSYLFLLKHIYGNNTSKKCIQDQDGLSSFRFIFDVFTRMRYCFPNGKLDIFCKDSPKNAPKILKPWFSIPNSITQEYSIVFGHWSSLENRDVKKGIYALDTGCCWGNKLTCLRWEDKVYFVQSSMQNR